METAATFVTMATSMFALIKEGIGVFLEPPLVYFVAFAGAAAGIKGAKMLIPRKRG